MRNGIQKLAWLPASCGSILLFLSIALNGCISAQETPGTSGGDPLFTKSATWNWPDLRLMNEQWESYLELTRASTETRESVLSTWGMLQVSDRGPHVLDQLLLTATLADKRVGDVMRSLESMRNPSSAFQAIDLAWFDSKTPGWLQENIKLAVARAYAQASYYDEALQLLEPLSDSTVIDPSTAKFYRAICYHHLLNKEKCVEQLESLLQRENELVSRYAMIAKLMQNDLQTFKADSLDEVARLMNDVERRLEHGRVGSKVRTQEKEIVDKLEKLIDEIEQEIQRQQKARAAAAAAKQADKNAQSKPLDESKIVGGNGPGDVDPKKLEKSGGWGDLPPAQRQESLQNITRDLPSHYREVIEAYFKKLGTGDK